MRHSKFGESSYLITKVGFEMKIIRFNLIFPVSRKILLLVAASNGLTPNSGGLPSYKPPRGISKKHLAPILW